MNFVFDDINIEKFKSKSFHEIINYALCHKNYNNLKT